MWRGEFAGDDQLRDCGFCGDLRRRHGALPSCELCRPMPVPRQPVHGIWRVRSPMRSAWSADEDGTRPPGRILLRPVTAGAQGYPEPASAHQLGGSLAGRIPARTGGRRSSAIAGSLRTTARAQSARPGPLLVSSAFAFCHGRLAFSAACLGVTLSGAAAWMLIGGHLFGQLPDPVGLLREHDPAPSLAGRHATGRAPALPHDSGVGAPVSLAGESMRRRMRPLYWRRTVDRGTWDRALSAMRPPAPIGPSRRARSTSEIANSQGSWCNARYRRGGVEVANAKASSRGPAHCGAGPDRCTHGTAGHVARRIRWRRPAEGLRVRQ